MKADSLNAGNLIHTTYLVLLEHQEILFGEPFAVLQMVDALMSLTFDELVADEAGFHRLYPRLTNEVFTFLYFC